MNLRRLFLLLHLFVLTISLAACSPAVSSQAVTYQTVTLGMDSTAVNTLIFIAEQQGFFEANGLVVNMKPYPSGLAAVDAMLNQEVDIAVASEFVMVGKTFAGAPVVTWGSVDKFMHNYLIARTDHGIQTTADLPGKKIGFPFQTAAEFYLGRFLELNELSWKDITPVNIGPANLAQALADGEVDAVLAWQPNAETIQARMGSALVRWPAQSEQVTYANLYSTQEWANAHPDILRKFLQSLIQAETFFANNPEEARAILQERLSIEDSLMEAIWSEHHFQVSLDQSMVLAMEDEARWMMNNQMVPGNSMPDFVPGIYVDALLAVRPDSVNIIR